MYQKITLQTTRNNYCTCPHIHHRCFTSPSLAKSFTGNDRKGEKQNVKNLCMIQLCEAALHFIRHVLLGHHLICHVHSHKSLNAAQYALPGQTCYNAVLHKNLFLDLSRHTLPRVLWLFLMQQQPLIAYSLAYPLLHVVDWVTKGSWPSFKHAIQPHHRTWSLSTILPQ